MTKLYYTIFNIIALAAIIYTGIDSFYRFLEIRLDKNNPEETAAPVPENKKSMVPLRLNDYQVINKRNIFSKIRPVPADEDTLKIENLEPTSLKIRLLGTVAGDQNNSVAIIEETNKRSQGIYRVGDSVQEALIKNILRGKVVLKVNDRDEILLMDESDTDQRAERIVPPGEPPEPAMLERTITVRRSDIEESLSNISDLLSQASIRPHFNKGEADGLAVTGIKAGSVFRKMGLRNGDIVKGVSENEIKTPEDLISLYNNLKSDASVSLQIMRRGRERTLNYRFRD